MPKSITLSNLFVNAALRATSFTSPAAVYVALHTTIPTPSGPGVEVSGGSYARQAVTWTFPSNGQSSNDADVTFPVATALWGTVVAFSIFDNVVGGNMLYFAPLNAPRLVQINDQVKFPVGQLLVIED